MPYDWGPHYIVPSDFFHSYSGSVLLREELDEGLLDKQLEELGIRGRIVRIVNPWYYRKKDTSTWVKIGESQDRNANFAVRWNTLTLENGQYDVMGLMHVYVLSGGKEIAVAGQNVAEVLVAN